MILKRPRNWQKSLKGKMGKTQIVLDTSAIISLGCSRGWKENLIIEYAKLLFEKVAKKAD